MNISSNAESWLAHHGLDRSSLEIIDSKEDRIYFLDPGLKVLEMMLAQNGDVSEPKNHGNAILSVRERATPSAQLCVHRKVVDVVNGRGKYGLYFELDFDFAPPINPVLTVKHAAEVIANGVTGGKTDQCEVAERLADRFTKERNHAT